jgi:hypothetical protein
VSLRNIPLCPITRAAFGACARASSSAVFHSNKSSEFSACIKERRYFHVKVEEALQMHEANHKAYNSTFASARVGQKVNMYTFKVKARPSRPSGKRTVSSFLSSLTTTLQMSARYSKI